MTMTVQEIMQSDLLESGDDQQNETLQLLDFMRVHGTSLNSEQIKAMYILKEQGLEDISTYALLMKQHTVKQKTFFDLISKLTLADRIKGNAKLSHLMKANANPAQTALKPDDVQAKGMSAREIDR